MNPNFPQSIQGPEAIAADAQLQNAAIGMSAVEGPASHLGSLTERHLGRQEGTADLFSGDHPADLMTIHAQNAVLGEAHSMNDEFDARATHKALEAQVAAATNDVAKHDLGMPGASMFGDVRRANAERPIKTPALTPAEVHAREAKNHLVRSQEQLNSSQATLTAAEKDTQDSGRYAEFVAEVKQLQDRSNVFSPKELAKIQLAEHSAITALKHSDEQALASGNPGDFGPVFRRGDNERLTDLVVQRSSGTMINTVPEAGLAGIYGDAVRHSPAVFEQLPNRLVQKYLTQDTVRTRPLPQVKPDVA